MTTCKFEAGDIYEDGYDPRGSGTDYYRGKCRTCGATFDFRVAFRDTYNERLYAVEKRAGDFCQLPEEIGRRQVKALQDEREKLSVRLSDIEVELAWHQKHI